MFERHKCSLVLNSKGLYAYNEVSTHYSSNHCTMFSNYQEILFIKCKVDNTDMNASSLTLTL